MGRLIYSLCSYVARAQKLTWELELRIQTHVHTEGRDWRAKAHSQDTLCCGHQRGWGGGRQYMGSAWAVGVCCWHAGCLYKIKCQLFKSGKFLLNCSFLGALDKSKDLGTLACMPAREQQPLFPQHGLSAFVLSPVAPWCHAPADLIPLRGPPGPL